jgi:cell division protease FtsH
MTTTMPAGWWSDIATGQVESVALGSDGSVSGTLTNGTKFTSSYPTAIQDPQFAQLLDQHNVQVETQAPRTSIWSARMARLARHTSAGRLTI